MGWLAGFVEGSLDQVDPCGWASMLVRMKIIEGDSDFYRANTLCLSEGSVSFEI